MEWWWWWFISQLDTNERPGIPSHFLLVFLRGSKIMVICGGDIPVLGTSKGRVPVTLCGACRAFADHPGNTQASFSLRLTTESGKIIFLILVLCGILSLAGHFSCLELWDMCRAANIVVTESLAIERRKIIIPIIVFLWYS